MSAAEVAIVIALLALSLAIGIIIGRTIKPSISEPDSAESPPPPDQPTAEAVDDSTAEATPGPETLDPQIMMLLNALPGMVIVLDPNGRVMLASDEATGEHLVRREILANYELAGAAAASLAQHETLVTEVTILRPPLRRGQLDVRVTAIPLSEQYVVLLLENLTEEMRVDAVRRDFIANISHELKTPVGAMSLLAEALVSASDDQAAVEHFAERMQMEAERLASLIHDVIDLSRLQGDKPLPNPRPVHVQALVEQTMGSVASAAEVKNIQMVIASGYNDTVIGDVDQLLIALSNLLTNAIAYSEPGTKIAIIVRDDDGLVQIDVKDQGIGIPEDELDRIFERFYRVDEARSRVTGGTGLGLSIVRNVCRNHGGDVSVWSVEGEGSTFTMQLPRAESDAVAALTEAGGTAAEPNVTANGTGTVAETSVRSASPSDDRQDGPKVASSLKTETGSSQ